MLRFSIEPLGPSQAAANLGFLQFPRMKVHPFCFRAVGRAECPSSSGVIFFLDEVPYAILSQTRWHSRRTGYV